MAWFLRAIELEAGSRACRWSEQELDQHPRLGEALTHLREVAVALGPADLFVHRLDGRVTRQGGRTAVGEDRHPCCTATCDSGKGALCRPQRGRALGTGSRLLPGVAGTRGVLRAQIEVLKVGSSPTGGASEGPLRTKLNPASQGEASGRSPEDRGAGWVRPPAGL